MDHATLVYNKLSLTHDQMKPTRLLKGSLSLSLSLATLAKKADSFRPARSIQQAFKLSTDPLAKRDDRPVSSTGVSLIQPQYALSFKCLFDIYRDLECGLRIHRVHIPLLAKNFWNIVDPFSQGLTWSIVLEYMHRCSIGQHVIAFANRGIISSAS